MSEIEGVDLMSKTCKPYDILDEFCICDICEVKHYCRDIDKENDDRCIYSDVDSCFYSYDPDKDEVYELSDEDQKIAWSEYSKIIKKRIIEFKKKRKYKKVY